MPKRFIVRLSAEEQQFLTNLVSTGKAAAYKIKHANLLLNIDINGAGWTDEEAATAFSCHRLIAFFKLSPDKASKASGTF